MNRKISVTLALVLVFAALMVVAVSTGSNAAPSYAPAPAITPVAAGSPATGDTSLVITYVDAAVTADTTVCKDLAGYRVADIEYVVDQTTINTTTVSLLHTNVNSDSNYTTGQVLATANAADATALNRFDLYGRYTCIKIDVTNSNPVTWTISALAIK